MSKLMYFIPISKMRSLFTVIYENGLFIKKFATFRLNFSKLHYVNIDYHYVKMQIFVRNQFYKLKYRFENQFQNQLRVFVILKAIDCHTQNWLRFAALFSIYSSL